jgi:hypothetical protein
MSEHNADLVILGGAIRERLEEGAFGADLGLASIARRTTT